jgi:hypothetical protein
MTMRANILTIRPNFLSLSPNALTLFLHWLNQANEDCDGGKTLRPRQDSHVLLAAGSGFA